MNNGDAQLLYETALGRAHVAESLEFMKTLPDGCVNLVMTSPPYARFISRKNTGTRIKASTSIGSFRSPRSSKRIIPDDGSIVIDIGGAWTPGQPTRSLYQFRTFDCPVSQGGTPSRQEFFWYNPAKLPSPAEWVNVRNTE